MQNVFRPLWRGGIVTLMLVVFLLSALLVSFEMPSIVSAQSATPTPTDPSWLGFATARAAIESEFNVNLTIIRDYSYVQSFFDNGIDSCVEEPEEVRNSVVSGWVYTITALNGDRYTVRVSYDLKAVAICDFEESSAEASASTPAPDGNNPTPVPGSAAVGGFEIGGHVLQLSANTVSLMNRAGMRWVKTQIRYNLGADPGSVAGVINNAKSNGFKVLLGIVGEPAQLSADFDGYTQTYSNFLGGVAALGADAIEVWNEPNIDREWPAGQINGASYTRLLAASYNAIKSRNPGTLVISGAPAPTGFFGSAGCGSGGCNDDVFMQQMAQAGAAQYLDCVGLHYNEGIVAPSTGSGDPRGEYPTYYFSSMLQRGYGLFGGKPVCFTELGYLSPEGFTTPLPGAFGWAANTSLQEHATWLAEAATRAAQSGKVRLMIIWNVDFPFYTATDPMGGYAMNRPDGTCPACDTLGAVMK